MGRHVVADQNAQPRDEHPQSTPEIGSDVQREAAASLLRPGTGDGFCSGAAARIGPKEVSMPLTRRSHLVGYLCFLEAI